MYRAVQSYMAPGLRDRGEPPVTYGCTKDDIANTVARNIHNGTSSPSLHQIKPCFIYENVFMGPFHSIQLKHSLMYSTRCRKINFYCSVFSVYAQESYVHYIVYCPVKLQLQLLAYSNSRHYSTYSML